MQRERRTAGRALLAAAIVAGVAWLAGQQPHGEADASGGLAPGVSARPPEPSEQPDATGAFTSLVSDARGVQLFVRHWPAASGAPPAGMVLVSHGYTGHSGQFAALAAHLTAAGFGTVAFDLPGHGRSGASTRGLRGYDSRPEAWVDDLGLMVDHMIDVISPDRGLPAFVYAESISGAATLRLLLRRGGPAARLAGAVVVGSAGGAALPDVLPFGLQRIVQGPMLALARAAPRLPMPITEAFGRWLFSEQFGDQEEGRRVFDADDLIVKGPNWRLGAVETMISVILPVAAAPLGTITTPVLVLQGELDAFLPPANARQLYDKLTGSACRRVVLFEGMRHWLSQETPEHRARVAAEVVAWLRARAAAAAGAGDGAEGCDNLHGGGAAAES